ncbi:PAP2 superfamily C-terminal-domain-containing protein [Linnemannia elongata]|nr:hypothetical protein BGZ88_001508 [Linnemannia elongata]KAF9339081.1 hypothetical protein BGZ91_007081 [Linnemannia elongata]KAG0060356.1 hypothetical protein BGZ89_012326 [Linnemannia elongata]KAG0075980.1 hypothetical protein BGZ90_009274 [Linnemannia elongata]KAH7059153.1 PAP2 superfamily C-terminal-domain-containing protein [Linnemannia elongata]
MNAQAEKQEHLSSTDSLQAAGLNQDRENRHSNVTMVNTSQTPPSTSPSPLRRHSNSNSSLSQNNNSPSSSPKKPTADKKRSLWDRAINSEVGRLVCSLLFFAVVCIAMAFCNQFSDHRFVKTNYTDIYLEDRGFDIFPAQQDITPANTFVMTSVVFTLIGIAILCPSWQTRIIVLRRVFWVVGALSVLRATTLSVTTMPTPKVGCKPATATGFGEMFWIALQMIPGTVQACTDDIFSGHTVFMVTCAIQWRLYMRNSWIKYVSFIYITVGLYFVIATRLHYTVDVVLAIFITYAMWSFYMAMVDTVMEKEYFGLRRHNEKYTMFDSYWDEKEKLQEQHYKQLVDQSSKDDDPSAPQPSALALKRAQLQHVMNRIRGPGIGYSRGEYDRVAFIPMQYNIWLTGLIRWCDGLDLRMRQSSNGLGVTRWEEYVMEHRTQQNPVSSSILPQHHQSSSSSAVPTAYQAYGKQEINDDEEIAGLEVSGNSGRPAMAQAGHPREYTTAPMGLDSIQIVSHQDTANASR